jgi:hypothetical protein
MGFALIGSCVGEEGEGESNCGGEAHSEFFARCVCFLR